MSRDLKNPKFFVRKAAPGAIGRAGEGLGYATTRTSRRLRALEKGIGTTLLNRTTRCVSLTPDGEMFLEHAKTILDAVEYA